MNNLKAINKYQIIGNLGNGQFGHVYHVLDRALDQEKAIKILNVVDPNQFMQSLEEAQIQNKCRHKHIVALNGANIFDVQGTPRVILDLEYVPNGSLEAALAARWVSVRDAVVVVRGALLGLEHAHSQQILHRDIKPGNILLAGTGAKLSDFGHATQAGVQLTGSAKGYTTHLPPEYFADRKTSVSSDVYAAGVTLYRAVTNITNWRQLVRSTKNWQGLVERGGLVQKLGYPDYVPKPIRRIINKACNAESSKRFDSARQLGQQLDKLRFNIDWIRVDDQTWQGRDSTSTYDLVADFRKFELVFKKNGRRKSENCGTFGSGSELAAELNRVVAETTLS